MLDHSFSCLCTSTSIKRDGLNKVLQTQTSPLIEMSRVKINRPLPMSQVTKDVSEYLKSILLNSFMDNNGIIAL